MYLFETGNTALEYFKEYYDNIYQKCFPIRDEAETPENLLYYLSNPDPNCICTLMIVRQLETNEIVGGSIFNYFKEYNIGIISYISIREDLQSHGLGTILYNRIMEQYDYQSQLNNHDKVYFVFGEVENNSDQKVFNFYNKFKFKKLDFHYIQPPLSPDKNAVNNLWFIANTVDNEMELQKEDILHSIHAYMKYCMQISDPNSNQYYQEMQIEILSKDKINQSELK